MKLSILNRSIEAAALKVHQCLGFESNRGEDSCTELNWYWYLGSTVPATRELSSREHRCKGVLASQLIRRVEKHNAE